MTGWDWSQKVFLGSMTRGACQSKFHSKAGQSCCGWRKTETRTDRSSFMSLYTSICHLHEIHSAMCLDVTQWRTSLASAGKPFNLFPITHLGAGLPPPSPPSLPVQSLVACRLLWERKQTPHHNPHDVLLVSSIHGSCYSGDNVPIVWGWVVRGCGLKWTLNWTALCKLSLASYFQESPPSDEEELNSRPTIFGGWWWWVRWYSGNELRLEAEAEAAAGERQTKKAHPSVHSRACVGRKVIIRLCYHYHMVRGWTVNRPNYGGF